ncbi:MAG: hypothetical protein JST59_28965 [Actinobacteria bacterium]|nr:hypothetical protein [Actinomycetota bacterium]
MHGLSDHDPTPESGPGGPPVAVVAVVVIVILLFVVLHLTGVVGPRP